MINRGLQWKYAWLVGITSAVLVACFTGPAWYFVRENYEVFSKIAYDTHPRLLHHLEREQVWICMLLILGVLAAGAITLLTTLRITTLLLGPLSNMEKHMRKLIRGDWSVHEFRVRDGEELQEIAGTYAYLYRTLRAQAEAEMRLLERIVVDHRQLEASRSWLTLMNLKRKQLGLSEIETSADSASSRDSRLAS